MARARDHSLPLRGSGGAMRAVLGKGTTFCAGAFSPQNPRCEIAADFGPVWLRGGADRVDLERVFGDPQTSAVTIEEAVAHLYASAGRQKRSYIRHFATLMRAIGERLRVPEAIPRQLGLDLERRLAEPGFAKRLTARLTTSFVTNAEQELELLRDAARTGLQPRTPGAGKARSAAKTTLRCDVPAGTVRCAARDGKVGMVMERDFSAIDRHRLEAAVAAFMAELDD